MVERDPGVRSSGNPVDVRGAAFDVVEDLGLAPRLSALATAVRRLVLVDASSRQLGSMRTRRSEQRELEVLRADLCGVLVDAAQREADVRFGDSITRLRADERGVDATFERAAPDRFDLVGGADGLHSTVRSLVFGPETEFVTHFGMYLATVPLAEPASGSRHPGCRVLLPLDQYGRSPGQRPVGEAPAAGLRGGWLAGSGAARHLPGIPRYLLRRRQPGPPVELVTRTDHAARRRGVVRLDLRRRVQFRHRRCRDPGPRTHPVRRRRRRRAAPLRDGAPGRLGPRTAHSEDHLAPPRPGNPPGPHGQDLRTPPRRTPLIARILARERAGGGAGAPLCRPRTGSVLQGRPVGNPRRPALPETSSPSWRSPEPALPSRELGFVRWLLAQRAGGLGDVVRGERRDVGTVERIHTPVRIARQP